MRTKSEDSYRVLYDKYQNIRFTDVVEGEINGD